MIDINSKHRKRKLKATVIFWTLEKFENITNCSKFYGFFTGRKNFANNIKKSLAKLNANW